MRTTIDIDDPLLERAKSEAAAEGRRLADVVNDALRLLFSPRARQDAKAASEPMSVSRVGGKGLQPGIDLEDRQGLADALDELSDLTVSTFLRIVTHRKVFSPPEPMGDALAFAEYSRTRPSCVWITPGPRHREIFSRLCVEHDARGKLVPDAWFAALAMDSGCTWVSSDRDFARFEGLEWVRPPMD